MKTKTEIIQNNKKRIFVTMIFLPMTFFFLPTQFYGDTTYVLLNGPSMDPIIKSGSLVIAKSQPNYQNGDVIAFINGGGTQVVHRIVAITDEGYITQGDNNSFLDGDVLIEKDIKGKALVVIPYLGLIIQSLKTPIGIAVIGIVVFLTMLPRRKSATKKKKSTSFALQITIGAVAVTVAHYVIEQILIAQNKILRIFLIDDLDVDLSIKSTISMSIVTMVLLILYLGSTKEKSKPKQISPINLIVILFGLSILILRTTSLIMLLPTVIPI